MTGITLSAYFCPGARTNILIAAGIKKKIKVTKTGLKRSEQTKEE